jgi:hypothetical protein
MLDSVTVTSERCRDVMRRHEVLDLHSLTLHVIDLGLLQPTLLPLVPLSWGGAGRGTAQAANQDELALALDGNLATGAWLSARSSLALDLGRVVQPRLVRLALCSGDGNHSEVALREARLQGSNHSSSADAHHVDLGPLIGEQPLLQVVRGHYLTRVMPDDAPPVRWLRIAVPLVPAASSRQDHDAATDGEEGADAGVCLAEIEVHKGQVTRELSELESGVSSMDVDLDLLYHEQYNEVGCALSRGRSLAPLLACGPQAY